MKKTYFTAVLTLMGSSFLFAQQWTGANNITDDISRTGKVSINTTESWFQLNVGESMYIFDNATGYGSINFSNCFYPMGFYVAPSYSLEHIRSSGSLGERGTFYIGRSIEKNIVIKGADYVGMGTDEFS